MSERIEDRETVSEEELVEKIQNLGVPVYHTIHRGDPFDKNPTLPPVCRQQYGCFEEIIKEMTPIITERNGISTYSFLIFIWHIVCFYPHEFSESPL